MILEYTLHLTPMTLAYNCVSLRAPRAVIEKAQQHTDKYKKAIKNKEGGIDKAKLAGAIENELVEMAFIYEGITVHAIKLLAKGLQNWLGIEISLPDHMTSSDKAMDITEKLDNVVGIMAHSDVRHTIRGWQW